MKRYIHERNTKSNLKLDTLFKLTNHSIESIKESNWKCYCHHVINQEEKYWCTDELAEETIENLFYSVHFDSKKQQCFDNDFKVIYHCYLRYNVRHFLMYYNKCLYLFIQKQN